MSADLSCLFSQKDGPDLVLMSSKAVSELLDAENAINYLRNETEKMRNLKPTEDLRKLEQKRITRLGLKKFAVKSLSARIKGLKLQIETLNNREDPDVQVRKFVVVSISFFF